MKNIAMLSLLSLLCACTYNVSMVHTEGQASDVIDETSANTPNIAPQIEIPYQRFSHEKTS